MWDICKGSLIELLTFRYSTQNGMMKQFQYILIQDVQNWFPQKGILFHSQVNVTTSSRADLLTASILNCVEN